MATPLVILCVALALILGGVILVMQYRRYANVGIVLLLIGWYLLTCIFPTYVGDEAPGWMHSLSNLSWYMVQGIGLMAIGILIILGYSYAWGDTHQIDLFGIVPAGGAVVGARQTVLTVVICFVGGVLAFIGLLMLINNGPEGIQKIWNWGTGLFTESGETRLVRAMKAHPKKEEFRLREKPLAFTWDKRLLDDQSKEDWRLAAQTRAKQEGDYTVKEVAKLDFRGLKQVTVHFSGTLKKPNPDPKVTTPVEVTIKKGTVTITLQEPLSDETLNSMADAVEAELPPEAVPAGTLPRAMPTPKTSSPAPRLSPPAVKIEE